MKSKEKGNIAEVIILAEFVKRGIQVSLPYGDNARYDLVADFNGKLQKIQVKYCGQNTINDSVACLTASSKNHTTNKRLDVYINDIDYFAFYIKCWEICILVPISVIGNRKSVTFRKELAKNNQTKGINFVFDYSFDKILCVETLHDESKDCEIYD